jgi:ferredoxin
VSRKIEIDRELCMGSGQCCVYAPLTFGQDETTIAVVADPDGGSAEEIRAAVQFCPTQALWFDEDAR